MQNRRFVNIIIEIIRGIIIIALFSVFGKPRLIGSM